MKFLIVGLGNIGIEYENTRHNIGFSILNRLASEKNIQFEMGKFVLKTQFKFKSRTYILLKPTTFMNLSGKAVKYWLDAEKVTLQNLLVITDDISLPLGKIRMKKKGSSGGHNGLKNIEELLNTSEYPRLRFGIGSDFNKGKQVDYVLGKFKDEEVSLLSEQIDKSIEMILSFGTIGIDQTMNRFNS